MSIKTENRSKGAAGESIAASYIKSKGFEILERNFTTKIGEIDIIAKDGTTLVFVEVKARANDEFGLGAEAITPQKRRKINQVASIYIRKHRLYYAEVRFDVVEIQHDERQINHIQNAFESYLKY